MSRIHTALALACVSLVALVPLALRVYAGAASVDRGTTVAANERVLRSLAHVKGSRRIAEHSYAIPRWGHEGGLVPTAGYRTELFLRLPRELPAAAIVAHYRGAVAAWRARGVKIEIAVVGRQARTYGVYVSQ
ncbi:MAG TPA: hypothetical protein VFU56_06030 [Gaiellaceae bacterium]|nr:hypothetical protein [Gaiellaceae bacterium]